MLVATLKALIILKQSMKIILADINLLSLLSCIETLLLFSCSLLVVPLKWQMHYMTSGFIRQSDPDI